MKLLKFGKARVKELLSVVNDFHDREQKYVENKLQDKKEKEYFEAKRIKDLREIVERAKARNLQV